MEQELIKNNTRMTHAVALKSEVEKSLFENRKAYEPLASLENLKWLSTIEAAQYLRVSVGSMKNMVYRGQIRSRKLGRRNRFLREELDRVVGFSLNKGEM
jgi:excisionase family DNA binding protein